MSDLTDRARDIVAQCFAPDERIVRIRPRLDGATVETGKCHWRVYTAPIAGLEELRFDDREKATTFAAQLRKAGFKTAYVRHAW